MPLNWSIRKVHDAFDKKQISPLELTKEFLKAAQADSLNAWISICEERALDQAVQAEAILKKEGRVPRDHYPLLGIPLGVKDIFTIQGVRTTCGSKMLENYISPYTATCVERLEAAGALTLGKTNMDEFAMGGSSENSAYGPVQHPTHSDRVPGGSSGGSAAAVRAGLCIGALGTDTGGSIRLPGNYCGIVGVKPTYGRVSRYGLVAFASSLDQAGPMTRIVEDAARMLEVMAGHDPRDSTSVPRPAGEWVKALAQKPDWKNLRIGVPEGFLSQGVSSEVIRVIQDAMQWFESQGAQLVPIQLPHSKYAVSVYYIVAVSEASSNLARFDGIRYGVRPERASQVNDPVKFYKAVRAGFGPEVKRRIILGTFALSSGYYDAYYRRACQVRRLIWQDFHQAFNQVNFIISPVGPGTAFKRGEKASDPLKMYLNDLFTIPVNLAGLPALSVPAGKDSDGLPIGIQLIGSWFSDEKLLSLAHVFEQARGTE